MHVAVLNTTHVGFFFISNIAMFLRDFKLLVPAPAFSSSLSEIDRMCDNSPVLLACTPAVCTHANHETTLAGIALRLASFANQRVAALNLFREDCPHSSSLDVGWAAMRCTSH